MTTTLQIDDKLLNNAVKLGHHKNAEEAVTEALSNYIIHLKQEKIISMFGVVEYSAEYDYKEQRSEYT
ncbi:MAG: type II toxin-antitoxin system VapB family antitoxin [Kiritimatiellae bacterium]|jgi:hypothetical protein|nr:type II toxin-antitoxin system VapB family antitoxin [Kiritimatiellia bacterium]